MRSRRHGRTPLTPSEARTIRLWTIGTLIAATVAILASPYTSRTADVAASLIASATFATGAVQSRTPTGFRLVLAAAGIASIAYVITAI